MHHQCPNIHAACYLGLYHLHPVLKTACQFHPGITPNQSNLLDVSHLHPGAISPENWFQNSCLTFIQVTSQFHTNQLHSDPISNPYRSQDVHLKSIHVLPHLHPGRMIIVSPPSMPPKVLLLCCSWGACVPCRPQRLCQLEFWLLVGSTMLDRLWARGQTKCSTPLMLATSVSE